MKLILKLVICCVSSFLLVSCLSPVKVDQPATYVLNATPHDLPKRSYARGTLMVMLPDSTAVYNSQQMAYTLRPHEIAYYGKNQWAEVPAQMLQPLIVQTLQKTRYFRAVVTPPFMGRYDYVLSTQILTLQQNYIWHPARYEMTVRAELSSATSGRVIAIKEFALSTPLSSYTPYGGVVAANQLTAKFLRELAVFVGRSVRR